MCVKSDVYSRVIDPEKVIFRGSKMSKTQSFALKPYVFSIG